MGKSGVRVNGSGGVLVAAETDVTDKRASADPKKALRAKVKSFTPFPRSDQQQLSWLELRFLANQIH